MLRYIQVPLILCLSINACCQKKIIDSSVYDQWPMISHSYITDDGKFVLYSVREAKLGESLIIEASDASWKQEFLNATDFLYRDITKQVFFKLSNDTLCIFSLITRTLTKINDVAYFTLPKHGNGQWFCYQRFSVKSQLVLINSFNESKTIYDSVYRWAFNDDGSVLFVETTNAHSAPAVTMYWISLPERQTKSIGHFADSSAQFNFDNSGTQLAFITGSTPSNAKLYYYKNNMDSALLKVDATTIGMSCVTISFEYHLLPFPSFSPDGRRIFFGVQNNMQYPHDVPGESSKLNIWNSSDAILPTEKKIEYKRSKCRAAVIGVQNDRVIILENHSSYWGIKLAAGGNGDWAIVDENLGSRSESYWQDSAKDNFYLVSLVNGLRKPLATGLVGEMCTFSPCGKFALWYNRSKKTYYTYNTKTSRITNITPKFPVPLYDEDIDEPQKAWPFQCGYWLKNDSGLLIYDKYDIWLLDPLGMKKPISLTNGTGRRNHMVFRILYSGNSHQISEDDEVLLSSFNTQTKDRGIYSLLIKKPGSLRRKFSGPFSEGTVEKAKEKNVYLLLRSNATSYPNLEITSDFTTFRKVTNYCPQKQYNWYTSKLMRWKTFDTRTGTGILYKPENFDKHKKYPVIFYYYERMSDCLNDYLMPLPSNGVLNIPEFVSNGYLVFVPDIYYKIGHPGQSAYNYIVSAAKFLAGFTWVDASHMGLQGHSFGGYETAYIITRTNIFAAAAPASGAYDIPSYTFNIRPGFGESGGWLAEAGILRIGATLWQKPNLYVENSPLYHVNQIRTPVLMMQNDNDWVVPMGQGLEFFIALRRAQKKAWMLSYNGEGHQLFKRTNQIDYTHKLLQFFNYYLKGAPIANWMQHGTN